MRWGGSPSRFPVPSFSSSFRGSRSSRWCSELISAAIVMSRSAVPSAAPIPFGKRVKRRVKFAAGSVEPKFRKVKLDAEVAAKGPKSRSEKSRAAWRNDPRRDEKILSYIGRLVRNKQPVRLSVASRHLVSAARKSLADAARAGVRIIPDLFVPAWDHSSDLMKMLGWGLAAREMGATLTRTVPEQPTMESRSCAGCLQWRWSAA